MSRYRGPQFKGAAKFTRDEKRAEAEARNHGSRLMECGHKHGAVICDGLKDRSQRLLRAIFGESA